MTFLPVLSPVVLIVIGVVLIALRLVAMRRLHHTAGSRWSTVWRWCGLTLAVLLVVIAAARPGIEHGDGGGRETAAAEQSNTNVFLIVDRSADSQVEDFADGQSRMSGIRADIDALIKQHPHARFAMISFAARPSMDWPLSDVGSSRVDLQACKLEYSIVSPK